MQGNNYKNNFSSVNYVVIVICSRNQVPGPGSKIPYLNYYPVFHRDRTKYHQFWPVFASIPTLNSIVVLTAHLGLKALYSLTSHSQISSFDYS